MSSRRIFCRQRVNPQEKQGEHKEGKVRHSKGSDAVSRTRRWSILCLTLLGTTLAILDSSVLNISVVPPMETFRTDLRTVKWVLTSYNLVLAMFMISFISTIRMLLKRMA